MFIVPEVVLNLVCLSIFSGLAALMSADVARGLWSLVCGCLNSYCTFHLFALLIFFSNWLLSALNSICLLHFFVSLYVNGSPLYLCLVENTTVRVTEELEIERETLKHFMDWLLSVN